MAENLSDQTAAPARDAESPVPGWTAARAYRWCLALPAVFLALFFLWPIATVVARSLTDPVPGFGNYLRVMGEGPYLRVMQITLETSALVTLLCLVIAYPVAYVMAHTRPGLFGIMIAVVVISLWTSVVIRSYAWMVVFQRRGVVNQLLQASGLAERPVNFIPGGLAVNVGMVHIMLPFMLLPLLATMRTIDRSLVTAAGVLGACPWQAFRKVFLPLSMPGLYAGCALVFMMSLGFFITPALLGGRRHLMAAVLIEQQANQLLDWGMASAMATVLLILTTTIYLLYVRVQGARLGVGHGR